MKRLVLLSLLCVILLVSCAAPPGGSPTPQSSVAPSAPVTSSPEATPSPSQTPAAEATPSFEPTPEPTPTPTLAPQPVVSLSDPNSSLAVRKGPGTDTPQLGKLRHNDPVTIIEQGDVWHKIEYNGGEGYVFAQYIKYVPVRYAYVPAIEATIKGKKYVSKMVDVRTIVPDIKIWLTFASQDNVMGEVLYPAGAILLQESTAKKLAVAQELFKKDGYRIRLYDGYRPYSVSKYLYSKIKDSRFVANPDRKPSGHNYGAAVDITLERISDGEQIPMYSKMHTFDISSMRTLPDIYQYEEGSEEYNAILQEYPEILNFSQRSEKAKKNVDYMTKIMKKAGFTTIDTEWWHFNDPDRYNFFVLDYNLAEDVQWIPAENYEEFMAAKEAEGPLTELPDYVISPRP